MKMHGDQRGIGLLGVLIIAMMVGFFVMSGIRIAPGFIEYRMVRDVVIAEAEKFNDDEDTISDIRRNLAGSFNTNQIKSIDYREVDIRREKGKVFIDANYEDRIPLFWRLDAVVKYDDLVFEAGKRYSD